MASSSSSMAPSASRSGAVRLSLESQPVIPPPERDPTNPASQGAQGNAFGAAAKRGDAVQQPPDGPPVRLEAPHQANTGTSNLPIGIAKLATAEDLFGTWGIQWMYERNKARLEWGRANKMSLSDMACSPVTGLITWHPIPGHSEFLPGEELDDEISRSIDPVRFKDLAREFLEQTKPEDSKDWQSVLPYWGRIRDLLLRWLDGADMTSKDEVYTVLKIAYRNYAMLITPIAIVHDLLAMREGTPVDNDDWLKGRAGKGLITTDILKRSLLWLTARDNLMYNRIVGLVNSLRRYPGHGRMGLQDLFNLYCFSDQIPRLPRYWIQEDDEFKAVLLADLKSLVGEYDEFPLDIWTAALDAPNSGEEEEEEKESQSRRRRPRVQQRLLTL
ncbi:hypothetical protein QBC42DRAFT_283223 [Cladorrhinum samala]|uniref:Uncharacterized protein n=1 Tax=Cladorrhinum samala TaxID=585594 RepID=A0AAV9HY09_9PEZI|nr:hypothetical protein QBC42DRAFT_283223 [Cladorrhinum samala]